MMEMQAGINRSNLVRFGRFLERIFPAICARPALASVTISYSKLTDLSHCLVRYSLKQNTLLPDGNSIFAKPVSIPIEL